MEKKPYIISTFSGEKGELPSARLVGSNSGGGGGSALPAVTSADNGSILRVVNGSWAAAALPSAESEVY